MPLGICKFIIAVCELILEYWSVANGGVVDAYLRAVKFSYGDIKIMSDVFM
jgi:hypothetical protein